MDREQRLAAVNELQNSVEDWKGHKIEHFGDLLMYGNFTVLKGDGAKDVEREVRERPYKTISWNVPCCLYFLPLSFAWIGTN